MRDLDVLKRAFVEELDGLLRDSALSSARITAVARRHGIGYSTLQSWRSGVHLPRTPDDNPAFSAFLFEVAANGDHARRTLELAKRSWHCAVQAKRQRMSSAARVEPDPATPALTSGSDIESAYAGVDDNARRLLIQLAASRCRDLHGQAASAMAGWPGRVGTSVLQELASARLIARRPEQRYAVPDAVRVVIGDRVHADDRATSEAESRLAWFYTRGATAAARRLFPDLLVLTRPPAGAPAGAPARFRTEEEAAAWLSAERGNLTATAEAVVSRDQALIESYTDALRAVQQVSPLAVDWTPLATAARSGAARHGSAIANTEYAAGVVCWWGRGRPASAVRLFTEAARRWAESHQPREHAAALHMLGAAQHAVGDCRNAKRHAELALRLRRRTGERRAQASTLIFLAEATIDLDQAETAEHYARTAATLAAQTGYSAGAVGALGTLGRALLEQGRHQEAENSFLEQQSISDGLTFHSRTAIALVGRALVCNHRQHFDTAIDLATEAVSAAETAGNAAAEADAFNAAATAHSGRGRIIQAQYLHRKALDVADRARYRRGRMEARAALARLRTR